MALVLGLPAAARPGTAWPSSATPAGPGSWPPTPAMGAGLEVPELSRRDPGGAARRRRPQRGGRQPRRPRGVGATPEKYEQALGIVLDDEVIDAVIVICTPTFAAPPAERRRRGRPGRAPTTDKPVLGCFLACARTCRPCCSATSDRVPACPSSPHPSPPPGPWPGPRTTPPGAGRPPGTVPTSTTSTSTAARGGRRRVPRRVPGRRLAGAGEPSTAARRRRACRIVRDQEVDSAEAAAQAAAELGFPVALKAAGPTSSTRATWAACASISRPPTRWPRLPVAWPTGSATGHDRRPRAADGAARRGDHRRGRPGPPLRAAA